MDNFLKGNPTRERASVTRKEHPQFPRHDSPLPRSARP